MSRRPSVRTNRYGKKYAYTSLFPIKSDAECTVLRVDVREMEKHEFGSPFSSVTCIHLARIMILDRLPYQGFPHKVERLPRKYLIFMCDFDGNAVEDLARALVEMTPTLVFDVWRHCRGFPFPDREALSGDDAVGRLAVYFEQCQVETSLYLSDQPDATVPRILRAMRTQHAFSDFVARHQLDDAVTLRREFLVLWDGLADAEDPHPGSL